MIGGAVRYFLMALLATSGGLGCWKYCTDAGCSSGLEITVLSSATTFAPGAYAVELEIDSDLTVLTCQIPTSARATSPRRTIALPSLLARRMICSYWRRVLRDQDRGHRGLRGVVERDAVVAR